MQFIPVSAPHWHLLLNHLPSIGLVLALGLLLASLYWKSEDLNRASLALLVILALIAIPTYITGSAAAWSIQGRPEISVDLIAAHQDAALLAFIVLVITGLFSWLALWQYRRFSQPLNWNVMLVLALGILSLLLMVQAGSFGGDINHPEIHAGTEAAAQGAAETGRAAAVEAWVLNGAWIWPAMEAAHFMGMAVLFGVLLLLAARVLGVITSVPFSAFHRLLPLGVLGFSINVVTGMLFFIADSGRYTAMTNSFFPKMALIALGGTAVIYFTIFDRPWALKAGDDAAVSSKVIAAVTVLMWSGVIVYGRLLPYLEGG